jgi:hypothetical protein
MFGISTPLEMGICRRAGDLVGFDRKRKSRLRFFIPPGAASGHRARPTGTTWPQPILPSCPAGLARYSRPMRQDSAAPAARCCISAPIGSIRGRVRAPRRDRQVFGKAKENPKVEKPVPTLTTFVSVFLANLTFHAGNGMGMIIRRTRVVRTVSGTGVSP